MATPILLRDYRMKLIEPDDPLYFEQSSYEPYDRHNYKVVAKNGDAITVDSYDLAREIWWNKNTVITPLSHIEVLDIHKGFK